MRSDARKILRLQAIVFVLLLSASCAGVHAGTKTGLSVAPSSLSFGSQSINASATSGVTLSNVGKTPLQVQNVTVNGSTVFQLTNWTGKVTLQPGSSLQVSVSFTPVAATTYSATLAVTTNSNDANIPLSGTGAAPTSSQTSVGISILPTAATLQVGTTQQFTATVTGTTDTSVTWLVNGVQGGNSTVGTINSSGLYTAPGAVPSGGTVTVTADSNADSTKASNAAVSITPAPAPVSVAISPTSATLQVGATQQFTASVTGTTNTSVTWLVNSVQGGNPTVGTINSGGLYTAPAAVPSGTVTVTALSSADTTKSSNAAVTITAAPAPVSVAISPTSATLQVGATQQFTASVSGTTNTGVIWQVNGIIGGNTTVGTISTGGLYSAPANVPSGGMVTVTAVSSYDTSASASSSMTIAAASTPVSVSVSPTSANLQTNQSQQFVATVSGTSNTGVVWQVNGTAGGDATLGIISSAGYYTAPSTVPAGGSITVDAVSSYDPTKSGSAVVSVSAPASSTGNNYYVSPSGSDSNPCTQTSPCATPAHAFNNASPGDTVHVAAGTYDNGSAEIKLTASGTSGNYITLISDTLYAAKLQNSVTGNNSVVSISGNYVKFIGFEVTNTGSGNNLGIFTSGAHYVISRNLVHGIEPAGDSNGGAGIHTYPRTADDTVIDSNIIYDIGWSQPHLVNTIQGIYINGDVKAITNNIVYHVAGGWGIQSSTPGNGTNGTIIANNTVFSNGNGGIVLNDVGGVNDYNTVINNIVVDNGTQQAKCGIFEYQNNETHSMYANNDAYGNAGGDYCFWNGNSQTGGISVDPASGTTFVNWQRDGSGDYHQKSGGPTIDAGTTACATGSNCAPTNDCDQNPRPRGLRWDIGAYEY